MNDYTAALLTAAIERLRASGTKNPDAQRLIREIAEHEQIIVRDNWIECRAAYIRERFSVATLIALAPMAFETMNQYGEWHYEELPSGDQDGICDMSASGIACVSWIRRELRGLMPEIESNETEIAAWMEHREPRQMSMFAVAA